MQRLEPFACQNLRRCRASSDVIERAQVATAVAGAGFALVEAHSFCWPTTSIKNFSTAEATAAAHKRTLAVACANAAVAATAAAVAVAVAATVAVAVRSALMGEMRRRNASFWTTKIKDGARARLIALGDKYWHGLFEDERAARARAAVRSGWQLITLGPPANSREEEEGGEKQATRAACFVRRRLATLGVRSSSGRGVDSGDGGGRRRRRRRRQP